MGDIIVEGGSAVGIREGVNAASLKAAGYRLIATNPMMPSGIAALTATPVDLTFRTRHVAAVKASKIKLAYASFANLSVNASIVDAYNDVNVGACIQKAGSTPADKTGYMAQCWFANGNVRSVLGRGALLETQPAFFDVDAGEEFFVNTYIDTAQAAGPSAPTLTESLTGGTLVGGATYHICIVYVFPGGVESATSAGSSITLSPSANTGLITITAPASVAGAIGWRAYMTGRNALVNGQYFQGTKLGIFGTDMTVTTENKAQNMRQVRAGGLAGHPAGNNVFGNTVYAGLDTGEGRGTGDATFAGVDGPNSSSNNIFGPVAVLGIPDTIEPTFALIGDSIMAATGDFGYSLNGGHATRAMTNQTAIRFSKTQAPRYAYVRVPLGGEQASQFAQTTTTGGYSRSRLAITEFADFIMSNYGTNDTSLGLASMKASILQIADWYVSRGKKFIQLTLLPKSTSSNAFTTAADQTASGTAATENSFNDWLRDTSASGFVAQAGGISKAACIDICQYTEVNSSNVLTQNGRLWRVPTSTVYATGALTSVTSAIEFTDTSLAGTAANTWMGYQILFTGGTASGKAGNIFYQNANVFNISNTMGVTPSIGDTYEIRLLPTTDGTHPCSQQAIWAAQAITEWMDANQDFLTVL